MGHLILHNVSYIRCFIKLVQGAAEKPDGFQNEITQ